MDGPWAFPAAAMLADATDKQRVVMTVGMWVEQQGKMLVGTTGTISVACWGYPLEN